MINLILAMSCSVCIASIMRISEKYTSPTRNISMLATNYIVCILLAVIYNGIKIPQVQVSDTLFCLTLGGINGFLYMCGFVLLQYNVKRNGVVLSSTFMRLGVLVPTLCSITIFRETPKLLQVTGFFIALAAIILISTEQKNGAAKMEAQFKLGLILILLAGGTADAMSKFFNVYGNMELENLFLVATFIFACLFCLLLLMKQKQKFGKMEVLFGIIIAIPNYYSARFLLKAVAQLQAFVAYPTYSVGTIVLTGVVGVLIFKEKISKQQALSLSMILCALVMLNL